MADGFYNFRSDQSYSASGTDESAVLSTVDKDKFSFLLFLDAPSGDVAHTMIVTIEESDEEDFSDAQHIFTLATFATITGTSSGTDLQERIDLGATVNPNTYLRAKVVTNNTTTFSGVNIKALYNTKP
jgi:hypothetical protein